MLPAPFPMCTQVYDASLQRDHDAEAEEEEGRASFRGGLRWRLEAGRELKAAGKALKWALKQQSAAEERYRCELAIYRAKCAQLENKKMTGTAAQRMSAAHMICLMRCQKLKEGTFWPP
jgi:hypothetical protein